MQKSHQLSPGILLEKLVSLYTFLVIWQESDPEPVTVEKLGQKTS